MSSSGIIALDILQHTGSCSSAAYCDVCPLYTEYPVDFISNITQASWNSWCITKMKWAREYITEHPNECFEVLL